MCKVVSIINQKGGTGKTTTTLNLGRGLSKLGFNTLLIDLDPQSNLSYSLALSNSKRSISEVLSKEVRPVESIVYNETINIIPSNTALSKLTLNGSQDQLLLSNALKEINGFDFILIDCPPSLSMLTLNALYASHQVLIPMQMDVFSIMGLIQIIDTVNEVNQDLSEPLEILGVLPVMFDVRKKLTEEVLNHIKEEINVNVFTATIRTNVKAAEAPSFGKSVLDYAPNSNSAKDYLKAAKEFLRLQDKELNITK